MTNQIMNNMDKVITTDGQIGLLIITGIQQDKIARGEQIEVDVRLSDGTYNLFSYEDLEFVSPAKPAPAPDLRVWVEYSHDDMEQMI